VELVIGSRQWSSWSLRAWLALAHLGLEFRTNMIPLRQSDSAQRIATVSPSGQVPVLIDAGGVIWDSLAICEYANEHAGGRGWPQERAVRAHARAASAEMHAGFAALRAAWPMEASTLGLQVELPEQGVRDVARIEALIEDCRDCYGARGPWLFGAWSIADAMYAPVVLRFRSYGAAVGTVATTYSRTVLADPVLATWLAAAGREMAAA